MWIGMTFQRASVENESIAFCCRWAIAQGTALVETGGVPMHLGHALVPSRWLRAVCRQMHLNR